MKLLREYRTKEKSLSDLLLYAAVVDPGIYQLNDGALLAAWLYRGPDMQASTHGEMSSIVARLNQALKLGSGWMIHVDCIRHKAPDYPSQGAFPDPTTAVIDDERRQQFMSEGTHFESDYFIALTFLPPTVAEEKFKGWFYEGGQKRRDNAERTLDQFKSRISSFHDLLTSSVRATRLTTIEEKDKFGNPILFCELNRYIRRTITGEDHKFILPDIPMYMNQVLSSRDFLGGVSPMIGTKNIRVVAISGLPKSSYPGIISSLDTLSIEFRWNTRAILLDPEQARKVLDKERRKWRGKIRGLKDQVMRTNSGAINVDAAEMAQDAELAMGVAGSGDVHFCLHTSVIVVMHEDNDMADEQAALVMKTIKNIGFDCRIENINAIEAWRGSLPGDGYRNVRRLMVHTINLADMLPITSVWAGLKINPSALMPKDSPALFHAATSGATPFRFHAHVSDLGHMLNMGPTGAGKSTLLGLKVSQWFRFPNAQVFAFDKGYSMQVLCRAAGGDFYDIAGNGEGGRNVQFCPLGHLETASDIAWAAEYIEQLIQLNEGEVGPQQRNHINQALKQLAQAPKDSRTLTHFTHTVQDEQVRQALEHYTLSGPLGFLLDASSDTLGSSKFMVFETEHLMAMGKKAIAPVLLYLFRCIERRLDGSPTLIPLDECWVFLDDPLFKQRIREWLKTFRRKNAAVDMYTQGVSDISSSSIKDVLIESCPTKIYLPNGEASNQGVRAHYDGMSLNDTEIKIIQTSTPKRHYYITSPLGRRLVDLGLGDVTLAFIGVNGTEERTYAKTFMEKNPETWQADWLHEKGRSDWADYWLSVHKKFTNGRNV